MLAKKSRDGHVTTVYVVNLAETPVTTVLRINGVRPRTARVTCIGSEQLTARNTPESPENVAPRNIPWSWNPSNPRLTLPARSFTSVRLSGE